MNMKLRMLMFYFMYYSPVNTSQCAKGYSNVEINISQIAFLKDLRDDLMHNVHFFLVCSHLLSKSISTCRKRLEIIKYLRANITGKFTVTIQ